MHRNRMTVTTSRCRVLRLGGGVLSTHWPRYRLLLRAWAQRHVQDVRVVANERKSRLFKPNHRVDANWQMQAEIGLLNAGLGRRVASITPLAPFRVVESIRLPLCTILAWFPRRSDVCSIRRQLFSLLPET